jgi:hypothetical protein
LTTATGLGVSTGATGSGLGARLGAGGGLWTGAGAWTERCGLEIGMWGNGGGVIFCGGGVDSDFSGMLESMLMDVTGSGTTLG